MTFPSHPDYRHVDPELESRLAEISRLAAPLPEITRLALAAAACASGRREATRIVLRRALEAGEDPARLREAILQTYLFAGYPRAINALTDLASLLPDSVPKPLDLEADLGRDAAWLDQGRALCRRVYGDAYERLLPAMARVSPDLGRWMVQEGYGKVLSRPLLDARVRELCAVAALLTLHVPVQLRAHLRGALLVGAAKEDVAGALRAGAVLSPEQLPDALRLLEDVHARLRNP